MFMSLTDCLRTGSRNPSAIPPASPFVCGDILLPFLSVRFTRLSARSASGEGDGLAVP